MSECYLLIAHRIAQDLNCPSEAGQPPRGFMKRYKTESKLVVVQSFLAREGGAKLLARRWSVPEEKVRTYVNHHSLHGLYGLSPKRSTYSAQLKLQVLAHQNREQRSSRQIAALYDIRNPNQIVVWLNPDQGGLQERESGNEE